MDKALQLQIVERLGNIDARLTAIETGVEKNDTKIDKLDTRLRSAEIKHAGISATVSGFVAIGITAIKQSFTGPS